MTPDLLSRLTVNPFADEVDANNFFTDELHQEVENKISYLTEFSSTIVFLHSELETGKTTLLKHLADNKQDSWHVCHIDSRHAEDWNSLLARLARCLNVATSEPALMEQQIKHSIQTFTENQKTVVVILDNAEMLPLAVLTRLNYFSASEKNVADKDLHIILCGRLEPQQISEQYVENDELKNLITFIPLAPFNAEQTRKYLAVRLRSAGISDTFPFDDKAVSRIQIQSKGQPSHINALAYSFLRQLQEQEREEPTKPQTVQSAPSGTPHLGFKIVAAALAISILISTIFMGSDEETEIDAEAPAEQITDTTNNNDRVTSALALPKRLPEDAEPEPRKPAGAQNESRKPDEPATAPPAPESAQPSQQSSPLPRPQPQTTARIESQTISATLQAHHAWLRQQNANHYTIQILGVSNENSLQSFIAQKKIQNDTVYYHRLRNGKDWYTLLYGSYSDRTAATNAANDLKQSLGVKSFWVRSYGDIVKEIE